MHFNVLILFYLLFYLIKFDHILIDKQKCSSVLDVQSFRAADYNTDHSLKVAKVKEKLVVEINSAWDTIRENIKTSAKESLGYYELK
jgi:hypothetical protein